MACKMSGSGGEENTLSEMESKCALLLGELKEVIAEYSAPKFSDQCDDDEPISLSKTAPITADIGTPGL